MSIPAQQTPAETEKEHFAYVDPANRSQQHELEQQFAAQLRRQGRWVDFFRAIPQSDGLTFPVEASVVIPVRNRERTIAQAVQSALSQVADFDYNVIVVDNASTDSTPHILASIHDPRLVVITEDGTPGIGGCWNQAINSPHAGRYVVQLDSDDVYAGPDTLSRIVATFRSERAAMVIGSYTLTDMEGNILPPGLIDHREWAPGLGPNNLLRVNGAGAPRAFYTPVIRQIGFPDVSYGEDYAAALAVSRQWRVARIFDSLYLCRRWEGNTDHALSPERKAANDRYKDSLRQAEAQARQQLGFDNHALRHEWDDLAPAAPALDRRRQMSEGFTLLHNPGRMASATAKTDRKSIQARPCFLCRHNRPPRQPWIDLGEYELLANPMPIFPRHMVVCTRGHVDQTLTGRAGDMLRIAARLEDAWPGQVTYFNGARAGASAPDHMHFQAGEFELPPFTAEDSREVQGLKVSVGTLGATPCLAVACPDLRLQDTATEVCDRILSLGDPSQGLVNALCHSGNIYIIFRRKGRPGCYPDPLVSPGAVEMAGYIVLPRQEDFRDLTPAQVSEILAEVGQTADHCRQVFSQL